MQSVLDVGSRDSLKLPKQPCHDIFLESNHQRVYRAPVSQLVEHRTVMREVVSSTPAGPTHVK